jgi:LSD1 subclass zinc finger protein
VPLVACPKCATNLKVPDGAAVAVRCPKCQTIFQSAAPAPAPAAPAFEVVDEAPPPKPAPKPPAPSAARPAPPPSAARPAPKPAPRSAAADDFEVVDDKPASKKKPLPLDDEDDRPRGRRRRDEDDEDDRPRRGRRDEEDDDRPRGRRRRDEEEEDDRDRPRRKPRREDDEDGDRGRGRRKGRRDEDDRDNFDDYDYSPPPKGSKFGVGRVGLLLLLISLGLYAGSLALHALFLLGALLGLPIPLGLTVVTGIMGLANWVVGLVGLGLCIAGPARSRGLAIAALSVAAVHLILAFVVVTDVDSVQGGSFSLPVLSALNKGASLREKQKEFAKEVAKNPGSARAKELREELKDQEGDGGLFGDSRSSSAKLRWYDLTTQMIYPARVIEVLSYSSKYFTKTYYLLGLFGGLAELARLILIAVLIGAMARVAKRPDAQSKAKIGWIVAASGAGACLLILLLTHVIADSIADDKKAAAISQPAAPPNTAGMDFQQAQRAMEDWRKQVQADAEKEIERVQSRARAPFAWLGVGELLAYLVYTGSLVMPGLAALTVFSATGRRGR